MLKYIRQGTLLLDQLTYEQLFEILAQSETDELSIFSKSRVSGTKADLVCSQHMRGYLFRDNKLIAEFTLTGDGEVQAIYPYTHFHEVLALAIELMDPDTHVQDISHQTIYWANGEFVNRKF